MSSEKPATGKIARMPFEPLISGRRKIAFFRHILIISIFLGIVIYFFGFLSVNLCPSLCDSIVSFLFVPASLLCFIVAIVTGIVIKIISLHSKTVVSRFDAIAVIVFLSVLVAVVTTIFLQHASPLVYTPPAITPNNLAVFNKCIEFARNHDEYKNLSLARWGWVSTTGDDFYILRSSSRYEKTKEVFSKDEITEMERLAKQLHSIKCHKFRRDNDIVLFYKTVTPIPPAPGTIKELYAYLLFAGSAIIGFLPDAPGVAYSLNGSNPNEMDSAVLNAAKPFTRIAGKWYTSRHLMLAGLRSERPVCIPKSLINCSLRTNGINPEDLEKLD